VLFAISGLAVGLHAYRLSGFGSPALSQVALFIARKIGLVIRGRQSWWVGLSPLVTMENSADTLEGTV
jgi:hypothetical protein